MQPETAGGGRQTSLGESPGRLRESSADQTAQVLDASSIAECIEKSHKCNGGHVPQQPLRHAASFMPPALLC
jgi:hypothetical protein